MIKRISLWSLVIILVVSCSLSVQAADSLLKPDEIAKTDWEQSVVRARGYGVAPNNIQNEAQAMIMAREAAITVAQRRLLGIIKGVQIDSEQKVKSAQVQSDIIIKQVKGIIRGAQIVKEKKIASNAYKVVLEVKFYGQDGIMKAIFPKLEASNSSGSLSNSESSGGSLGGTDKDSKVSRQQNYTGVIINTVNLKVEPAMLPKIYNPQGDLIYGIDKIKTDSVIKQGIVGYTRSLADAKTKTRIGNNPLILQAKQVRGSYQTDLVLSAQEARLLEQVGTTNNIFNDCKLIIVLN